MKALAQAGRRDAVMFGVFYGWILAWLHPYMNLPFHSDAVGYVSHHTYNIYQHPFFPLISGDYDVGHPTLFYWIAALLWRMVGVNLWSPRLLVFAFGAFLLLYTYKIGKRLGLGVSGALIAPLTLSLTPLVASQTAQFQLDIPLTALFAASAYYQLKGNRPGRLACFGAAMVLCKLTGILLLVPLMVFALIASIGQEGWRGWKSHARHLAPFAFPIASLALFFLARYLYAGTIVARFHEDQGGMSFDWKSFLAKAPYYLISFTFYNDAYLLVPVLVLALILFWRPGRPAIPKSPAHDAFYAEGAAFFSWRQFALLGVLVLVFYSVPHILKTYFAPLPRYFLCFLPFLHLAAAWAFLRFWRVWKPVGALLLLFLCIVLLFHWHPKRASPKYLHAFQLLLQNHWLVAGTRSGEETFEWVDHVYVAKRMMQRIEREYPNDRVILAVYPESAELMCPYTGYVSLPRLIHAAWTPDQFRRAIDQNWVSLCLFTSQSSVNYDMEAMCNEMSLRLVKRYRRHNAWCALYEKPAPPKPR